MALEKENGKEEQAEREKELGRERGMEEEKEIGKEKLMKKERKYKQEKAEENERRKQKSAKPWKKNDYKHGWFLVGSSRRLCMVIISYVLALIFLGSSFVMIAYFRWFGTETAHTYEETERFQQRMQSRMEKAAPAWKHYFQQETAENQEMVKIYGLKQSEAEKGGIEGYWQKTYTCESGGEIAGFLTDFKNYDMAECYYQEKKDQFIFPDPDSHFVERWESEYNQRSNGGVQMYFAVSRKTMKEWIQEYGKINGIGEYLYDVPDDAYYIKCSYSLYGATKAFLCYSESKDHWYYLEEDNYGTVRKQRFRMPNTVYFPLCSVEQSGAGKADSKKEFSDGLSRSNAYLKNGIIYSKTDGLSSSDVYLKNGIIVDKTPELPADHKKILKTMPFFNLKTILYEAGKEYYHQKSLLHYIDKKMGGYLWKFTFHSDSSDVEDMEIGDMEIFYGKDAKEREIRVVYNSLEALPETAAALALEGIGKEWGYGSVTAELALPKYSPGMLVFGTQDQTVKQSIRYSLERWVFYEYHDGIWIAIIVCSFLCWIYIMGNLLFAGGKKVKISGGEEEVPLKKEIVLSRFDQLPIEIGCLLTGIPVWLWLFCSLVENCWYFHSWRVRVFCNGFQYYCVDNRSMYVLIQFFILTAAYFFCYAWLASLIRRIRMGVLWKNSLILKALRWCRKKAGNTRKKWHGFFQDIWRGFHSKNQMLLLLGGYILASVICGTATIIFFIGYFAYYDSIWLMGIFTLLLFLFLQGKAVRYMLGNEAGKERILNGIRELSDGNLEYEIDTRGLSGEYLEMAQMLPKLRDGLDKAIQKSLRDERMKTELITNVSHDIKTPLTSMINYVDLLKRAKPQGEHVEHYLDVLTQKSERLRHLIEDLVEASKASSGTLALEKTNLDLTELVQQTVGEFEEKLAQKNLQMVIQSPNPPVTIFADGQRMFRILENLFQNVYKYAMEGTRVYLDLEVVSHGSRIGAVWESGMESGNLWQNGENSRNNGGDRWAVLMLRNISAAPLNISEEELTERFVRGEESRTTEGSGLGLSIAKDLVRLQGGEFWLKIDGDLFKVVLEFPVVEKRCEK